MFLHRLQGGWSFPTHLIFILRHASQAPICQHDWPVIVAPPPRHRAVEELECGEGVAGHLADHGELAAVIGYSRDGASTRALVS